MIQWLLGHMKKKKIPQTFIMPIAKHNSTHNSHELIKHKCTLSIILCWTNVNNKLIQLMLLLKLRERERENYPKKKPLLVGVSLLVVLLIEERMERMAMQRKARKSIPVAMFALSRNLSSFDSNSSVGSVPWPPRLANAFMKSCNCFFNSNDTANPAPTPVPSNRAMIWSYNNINMFINCPM